MWRWPLRAPLSPAVSCPQPDPGHTLAALSGWPRCFPDSPPDRRAPGAPEARIGGGSGGGASEFGI
eukprot:10278918-Alexandrium_andersonii.AAC.1